MKIVLAILALAMIAKDASYLGDPYIMRGTAQGLCLIVGGSWLLTNLSPMLLKRYWPLFGYMIALFLSIIGTRDPVYVAFQVISLVAVIVLFIAYFESRRNITTNINATLLNTTIIAYAIALIEEN
jgi:hypothetical protein